MGSQFIPLIMSAYYNYEFVSPEPIFAQVKEELRSYFDTGVVDDLLFETYLSHCLSKLSKSAYKIDETILHLKDFEADLPDDFKAVREAWLCTSDGHVRYPDQSSFYYQRDCRVTRIDDSCNECFTPQDPCCTTVPVYNSCDPCDTCGIPEKFRVTHKVTGETVFSFQRHFLLKPGNISKLKDCNLHCRNFGSTAKDTFDVADCVFRTNFSTGVVHLLYYAEGFDDTGYQLVPDNFRIKEYVKSYITYMVFDQLYKQSSTENYAQRKDMWLQYGQKYDEAFILADIETKKSTLDKKVREIKKSYKRFRRFNIR